jgi:hypothetical protein
MSIGIVETAAVLLVVALIAFGVWWLVSRLSRG